MPGEKKEDLKQGTQPEGAGQPEKKEPTAEEIEAVRVKKLEEELATEKALREKTEQERDNYKTGLISAKAKKMTLTDDEKVKEVKPVEDDESWKEVERRATKIADEKYDSHFKVEAKQNERIAIKKFLGSHPEVDNALWGGIKDEYIDRHGKSVDGILFDLERGYKLYKLDNNISFVKPKEEVKVDDLANSAGAGKSSPSIGEFNENEKKVMSEYGVSPENFKIFRTKVLNGEMSVPESVINLLKQD